MQRVMFPSSLLGKDKEKQSVKRNVKLNEVLTGNYT
jgi:hypothetical protein